MTMGDITSTRGGEAQSVRRSVYDRSCPSQHSRHSNRSTTEVMSMQNKPMHIAPFTIRVPDAVLSDLTTRIRNTRWPAQAPGTAWAQGTDLDYLKRLLSYWADGFDWRAQERRLNTFAHFRAELGDIHVHFVHERAREGNGIPLILTHGWPSSFLELLPLVPLLTNPKANGIDGSGFRPRHSLASGIRLFGTTGTGKLPHRCTTVA